MIHRIMNWMGDVKLDYFMFHLYMSVFSVILNYHGVLEYV